MLTNTCTIEQSSGRMNILIHAPHGRMIEVRNSYVGLADGNAAAQFSEWPDGSYVWHIDGKLARVAMLVSRRFDPAAPNAGGMLGAFVPYTDWPLIENIVDQMRMAWGDLPVQVNAA